MATYISSGTSTVSSGQKLGDPYITQSGRVNILAGGTMTGAKVSSGGQVHISSGGIASVGTYGSGGTLVLSGGTSFRQNVSGGKVVISGGRFISGTISGGVFSATSSGSKVAYVTSTTLTGGASMYLYSGGMASFTVISSGLLTVYRGAQVLSTTLGGSANLYLQAGAIASVTNVSSGAIMRIFDAGASAVRINVFSGGSLAISGGYAESIQVEEAQIHVASGGKVATTYISAGGLMYVDSGCSADGVTVTSSGRLIIQSVGAATSVTVQKGASVTVNKGGSAYNIVESGGIVNVSSGAVATFAANAFSGTVDSATVHSGTTANYVTVNSALHVYSGGRAIGVTIGSDARLAVSSGGSAQIVSASGSKATIDILNGATVVSATLSGQDAFMIVSSGATARDTTINNGSMTVYSSGTAIGASITSGCRLNAGADSLIGGRITITSGALVSAYDGSTLDFDLTQTTAGADALVNDISRIYGAPTYTLTVGGTQANGVYKLAGNASGFNKTITVKSTEGGALGTLTVGQTTSIGGVDYTLNLGGDNVLTVSVGAVVSGPVRGDRDGNGVSDVMFVWTGNNYAHGYWMNGTSDWWSANSTGVSADWDNLGSYDMSGDGKADAVMFGNVEVGGAKGAYIGYYQDGDDANGWVNIGFLDNSGNTDWKNTVGNLTGGTANSIVWYAPELYALGAWTDGTDTWVTLGNTFGGADWTLVGCGDFDGDGKDSVVMSYNGGQFFYLANLDGATASLGNLNWSGWEVRAIGDFAGDGRDDIVLFHAETGSMVMLANGIAEDYTSIGQLDPADWFVAGCGDYNGDGSDDLLVRQYSTGMLGYYSNGDTTQWNVLGYGVDMSWTVIA